MTWCEECFSVDTEHMDGCRLDPKHKRQSSRRDFIRTMGVLGAGILVAPSLLSLPKRDELIFSIDMPYQIVTPNRSVLITTSGSDVQKMWRKVQGKMMEAARIQYTDWDIPDAYGSPRRLL